MKPGKSSVRNLPRRFRHLLLQLAEQARNDLKKIPRRPRRSIHSLRTRLKKLSAIVRLVESRIPQRQRRAMMACAKQLGKAFAAQRDTQVAADLGFKGKPQVRQPVAGSQGELIERLIRLIDAEKLEDLTREQVCDAYVKTYRAGRRRMKACIADPEPARLHAWRKFVKELYYQTLALHREPGMRHRIRPARKLGRWLGQDHDWQLIIEREPAAAQGIGPERERLRNRIFKLAGKLYSARPKKLARKLG